MLSARRLRVSRDLLSHVSRQAHESVLLPGIVLLCSILCIMNCCAALSLGSLHVLRCLHCPAGVAEDIGRQLLVYGRRIPKAELFARIDAVDEETVKDVASRFIYDQELAIAAVGDCQFLPDYNWFRRRT